MGPLLAVVASDFNDITLTQDGTVALVSFESDRGPVMLALPAGELGPLAARARALMRRGPAERRAELVSGAEL